MIQRRTTVGLDPPCSQRAGTTSVTTTRGGNDNHSDRHRRRARKQQQQSSTGSARRRSRFPRLLWWRSLRRGFRTSEDVLVTLVQIASVFVVLGCGVTVGLRLCRGGGNNNGYYGFGYGYYEPVVVMIADDDDGVASSERLSWMTNLRIRMSRWRILSSLARVDYRHPMHRDHENAGTHHTTVTNIPYRLPPDPEEQRRRRQQGEIPEGFEALPPSSIYTIPGSMPHIGDKSDEYARLRKEFDAMDLPAVEQRYRFRTMPMDDDDRGDAGNDDDDDAPSLSYDIRNCPEHPPEGYPYAWNLLELLDHWPPDDPRVPEDNAIYQGLCVFDYETEYEKALNYRNRELPFIVSNDPEVQETAKRWMAPGYLDRLLGDVQHRTEYSESNHFMYWNAGRNFRKQAKAKKRFKGGGGSKNMGNLFAGDGHPDGRGVDRDLEHWQQPTTMMRMGYQEWLSHANLTEGRSVGPHDPHYYYRLIGCGEQGPLGNCDKGSSEYLFDELTFFQPKPNLYMVQPDQQKGIHCRFGMTGVIAENHFDQSRNTIALMGGERRYVLAHPDQCPLLSLLPQGHPSARHSAVDWSDPDLVKYPEFAQAVGNEVVLQAGDVLYLPTNWFHFIVSLNLNFQCNSRSGVTTDYFKTIKECGFSSGRHRQPPPR